MKAIYLLLQFFSLNGANKIVDNLSHFRQSFKSSFFAIYYNFREVVRRTTVIIFTNKEDYIIASNKGGDVYRLGLFQLRLLTDMTLCPLEILVN